MPHPYSGASPAGGGWAHRLALLTLGATLLLITVGALVTSLGAGLAVPDWPTTFGYSMFAYPWSKMVGGILFEHSHRLMGSLAGILTILTAALLLWRDERRWMRALGVGALALVILQGVLGGLRVVLLKLDLAMVHACTAQLFFGLMAGIALFTSRAWRRDDEGPAASPALVRLASLAAAALFIQTALGAHLRHTGEWPDGHLMFSVIASAAVLWTSARALHECGGHPGVRRAAHLMWIILLAQILLGLGAFIGKYTEWADALVPYGYVIALTAGHVAGGSLLFACSVVLVIWLRRLRAAAPEAVGSFPRHVTA